MSAMETLRHEAMMGGSKTNLFLSTALILTLSSIFLATVVSPGFTPFFTVFIIVFMFLGTVSDSEFISRIYLKEIIHRHASSSAADPEYAVSRTLSEALNSGMRSENYIQNLTPRQMRWIKYRYDSQFNKKVKEIADKHRKEQQMKLKTGNVAEIDNIAYSRCEDAKELQRANKAYTVAIESLQSNKSQNLSELEQFDRELQQG